MSAVISLDQVYRYRLERDVQPHGCTFAYFGVNPSTADAEIDDQTVRKWRGFTKRNGGARFIVGNTFAFRATDVKALSAVVDPVGPCNRVHLNRIIAEADVLVLCWGNVKKVSPSLRHHFDLLRDRLIASWKLVKVFGLTKAGDPRHPLMLGYATKLVSLKHG